MKRIDPLTGELFQPKRVTQRFASEQNRIRYHNQKASELRQEISFVNKPLLNNLRILNELLKNNTTGKYTKEFLLGKGFSFGVFTHYQIHEGNPYCAIYHYLIISLPNEQIQIIRKHD